ncbi:MAG: sulfite exporter TauE/SafE family protein [Clostridia bacterium]|nr:sulfite exporter TauE/SafE family protein [Clostridia bacterium]
MSTLKKTWHIAGMHCPHCETAILRAVGKLEGISQPEADYRAGTLTAQWTESLLPEEKLAECISEAGYELKLEKKSVPRRMLTLLCTLLALVALYLLFAVTPLEGMLSSFPTARAGMSLGALFVVGLLTSLHCVAMCGGINLAHSAASAQSGGKVSASNIQYNAGRFISYTVVGGIVGALGSVLRISTAVQSGIQIVAAIFMVLMALNMLDIGGWKAMMPTLPVGLRARLLGKRKNSSLWIGLINGLMPCGPLQAMQLYALSTGSWYMGALSMASFCLGTIPLMLGFGLVSGKLNKRFAKPMRIASGALVLVMGMAMLTRGLSLSGVQVKLPGQLTQADAAVVEEGYQNVSSELDWRGYPDITVKANVPVHWVIHADEGKITGCNNEMVIPGLNLRVPLQEGDNVVEFTAAQPGVIPYTCWMGMLHGSITVEE